MTDPNEFMNNYLREREKHDREMRERVKNDAPVIRNDLLGLGVVKLVAEYDGQGDSGSIEEISLLDKTGTSLYLAQTNIPNPVSFQERLEGIFYDLLATRCAGWEINEGSYGGFEWDLVEDKIEHIHNQRIEQIDTTTYEGF